MHANLRRWVLLPGLVAVFGLAAGCSESPGPEKSPEGRWSVDAGPVQMEPVWFSAVQQSSAGAAITLAQIPDEDWNVALGARDDRLAVTKQSAFCVTQTVDYDRSARECLEIQALPIQVDLPAALLQTLKNEICGDLDALGQFACNLVTVHSVRVQEVENVVRVTWDENFGTLHGRTAVEGVLLVNYTVVIPPLFPGLPPVVINGVDPLPFEIYQDLAGTRCDSCTPCGFGGGGGGGE